MKITLEQLKRLIRETVEEGIFMDPDDPENTNNPLNYIFFTIKNAILTTCLRPCKY